MAAAAAFVFRADWTNIMGRPIDLGVFATNLTDNVHIVGEIQLWTSLGFSSVAYNPPRMFGFTLKYHFDGSSEPPLPAEPHTPPPPKAVAPAAPRSYLVFFDFNKSDLTGQAEQIVDQAASNAGPAKVTRLTVTRHTETVGSDAYNLRLSRRRAESVAARLEKYGIASSEIEIVAKASGTRWSRPPTGYASHRTGACRSSMTAGPPRKTPFITRETALQKGAPFLFMGRHEKARACAPQRAQSARRCMGGQKRNDTQYYTVNNRRHKLRKYINHYTESREIRQNSRTQSISLWYDLGSGKK